MEKGRPQKTGLDFFELDCYMDSKIKLIQAEYGLWGFAIVIKLFQKIYGEQGYYCKWDNDEQFLFMSDNGISQDDRQRLSDLIKKCAERDIFSQDMLCDFAILTSSGIQKRYFNAVRKRKKVYLMSEYILAKDEMSRLNTVIKSLNGDIKSTEKRREEKSKEKNINAQNLFEQLWKIYPKKKGKANVSNSQKLKLLSIGYDKLEYAVNQYKEYVKDTDMQYVMYGSTFFNSGYVDYLPEEDAEDEIDVTKYGVTKEWFESLSEKDREDFLNERR